MEDMAIVKIYDIQHEENKVIAITPDQLRLLMWIYENNYNRGFDFVTVAGAEVI